MTRLCVANATPVQNDADSSVPYFAASALTLLPHLRATELSVNCTPVRQRTRGFLLGSVRMVVGYQKL
jgi:hypothetical protein